METAVDILLLVLLALICFGGLVLTVFQLPGVWLIVVAAAGYAWHSGWQRISITTLGILVAVAVLAEVGEAVTGMVVARKGGASRRAAWYGLAGGMLGAMLLTVPIPVFGTIAGAAIGCFAGAFVAELQEGRNLEAGARSGAYSALGRTMGSMLKMTAAVAVSGAVLAKAIASFW